MSVHVPAPDPADLARSQLVSALQRVAAGDRSALREVYDRTSAKLMGIVLRICPDRGVAEDIVQDVYVKVWNRAGRFDPQRASPVTWLSVIARNSAIDWRRSVAARSFAPIEAAGEVADPAPDAEAMAIGAGTDARVHHCLGELDERTATAIRSAFFDGISYPELAAARAVPLGTLKSWIRRGLLKLRECLGDG